MKKTLVSLTTALALAASVLPAAAFADTSLTAGVKADVNVNAAGVHASTTADLGVKAKARADQEIERRLASLNELSARVSDMKHLTADQKTALQTSIKNQIDVLTSLEVKINADTDLATLKTDIQSITKSYRIYMLVLPQGRVQAVVDRVDTITGQMDSIAAKLKARMDLTVESASTTATYNDLLAKIADAKAQSAAALALTVNLKPDNGDATVQASNTAAIKDAKAKLATATADLKAARQDIVTLIKAVGGVHGGAGAHASTTGQVHGEAE